MNNIKNRKWMCHPDSVENIGARDAFPIPFLYYLWYEAAFETFSGSLFQMNGNLVKRSA